MNERWMKVASLYGMECPSCVVDENYFEKRLSSWSCDCEKRETFELGL